ncbi:phosphatase PAP2 family protein [Flavobacteriaceae bacterium W22]|nr:phosphatase PAP2 family protein [Flavobacteriaceae bacterium W22]
MLILLMQICCLSSAQDSLKLNTVDYYDSLEMSDLKHHQLSYKKLIVPASLITAGAISFAVPQLKEIDRDVRGEVNEHNLSNSKLDNYTQYVPAAMVYALNIAGFEGKHNFKERTIMYATSQALTAAIVLPSKKLIGEERPDKSNNMSFPSGHAAVAFSTAHFLFREYKDANYWLGISGYSFAVFTSVYRVINNKHWVTDVFAGAGVGILSTELSYWLYPKIISLFEKKKKKSFSMIAPYYQRSNQSNMMGLSYQLIF